MEGTGDGPVASVGECAHEDEGRRAAWRAVVNPAQLVPLFVAPLFALGQSAGFIADVALWQLIGALLFAQIASSLATAVIRPGSTSWRLWLRVGAMCLPIGIVIYLTGWGATLAVGLVFGVAECIRVEGSPAARSGIVLTCASIALGEVAIAQGWIPTLLPEPEGHGFAVLAAIGASLIIALIGWTTARKEQVEDDLSASEERFRALVQHGSDVIMVVGTDGEVLYASPSVERTLGYADHEVLAGAGDWVHPEDRTAAVEFFSRMITDTGAVAWFDMRLRHVDESWRWFEVGVTNRSSDPSVGGFVCIVRDITERKQFENRLAHQANHDDLTGLPNRTAFLERLERALARARHDSHSVGVLFLDVDRFKLVNDSLGHDVGDRLLVEVADRLRDCLRPGDVVARFGGDEFTVLLENPGSSEQAVAVAARITSSLKDAVVVEDRELHVTSSIGIAISSDGQDEAGDLLRQADLAMYLAKQNGRARWEMFDALDAAEVVGRLELEGDLWHALEHGELVVHFQPELSLLTGRIVAVEALIRWEHPRRGLLEPEAFVPFAEESSLIVAVDRFVLREASRWSRIWNGPEADDGGGVMVSVNLSPRYFRQRDTVGELVSVVEEAGAELRRLQVEITERTALTDVDRTVEVLARLRELGVSVAIDDFGTGYSSLGYLKRLPVDVVKLDRTFVECMDTHSSDVAIVQAVITMGHALGMEVTAEGVEWAEQAARLRALGCDRAMGWLWSRALPAEEVASVLLDGLRGTGPVSDAAATAATVIAFPPAVERRR